MAFPLKAQDGWPPTPHCTSWLKGQETEISTAGRDCKVYRRIIFTFTWEEGSEFHKESESQGVTKRTCSKRGKQGGKEAKRIKI